MDRTSYLDSLRAETELLVDAARTDLGRPVPTCPGWTCERLVGHIGRVHRWTAGWIVEGAAPEVEQAPDGPAVLDWARAALDALIAVVEQADPDAPVDTWAGSQPAIFWPRRMALETAVHRVDAQLAGGAATPVATSLALAGVAELLDVLLPLRGTGELERHGETLHLHATDPDLAQGSGEWLVTLGEARLEVERAHAKGDVAVRGSASDLFLLLWNRVGVNASRCSATRRCSTGGGRPCRRDATGGRHEVTVPGDQAAGEGTAGSPTP